MRKSLVFALCLIIGVMACQPAADKSNVEEAEVSAPQMLERLIQQFVDAERAGKLAALLGKLPGRIDHGQHNLGRPPQRVTEAAIFQTRGTIASVRDRVPPLAEQVGTAGEDLLASSEAALQSLEDYLQFLEQEPLPRSDGNWAIGNDLFANDGAVKQTERCRPG